MRMYMSKFFALLVSLLLLLGCSDRSTAVRDDLDKLPRAGSFTWVGTSVIYSSTVQKKPASLLIVVNSECPWCDSLEQWTLTDSTVMGMIDSWYNPAIINADSDSLIVVGDSMISCRTATRDVFHIRRYPTTIIFDNTGGIHDWLQGFLEPNVFADRLYWCHYHHYTYFVAKRDR